MKTIATLLFSTAAALATESTAIKFIDGPPKQNLLDYEQNLLDINLDGTADFEIAPLISLCTADVPTSGCVTSYSIAPLEQNELLCYGIPLKILPAGTIIGPDAGTNNWRNSHAASVASLHWNLLDGTSHWSGPLATAGSGYIGVRFNAADGIHYGWIYATLSTNDAPRFVNDPIYHNWAFESRPNTPIAAGALPIVTLEQPQLARSNYIRLTWKTEPGHAYQLQAKDEIDAPWMPYELSIVGSSTTAAIDAPISSTVRFYRVVRVD